MGRDNFHPNVAEPKSTIQKAVGKDTGVSVTSIQIAKNRNGRIGKVTLMFTKDVSKFDNPTLEMEQAAAKEDGVPFEPDRFMIRFLIVSAAAAKAMPLWSMTKKRFFRLIWAFRFAELLPV
jgi:hypothetical protein